MEVIVEALTDLAERFWEEGHRTPEEMVAQD